MRRVITWGCGCEPSFPRHSPEPPRGRVAPVMVPDIRGRRVRQLAEQRLGIHLPAPVLKSLISGIPTAVSRRDQRSPRPPALSLGSCWLHRSAGRVRPVVVHDQPVCFAATEICFKVCRDDGRSPSPNFPVASQASGAALIGCRWVVELVGVTDDEQIREVIAGATIVRRRCCRTRRSVSGWIDQSMSRGWRRMSLE